jgi:hypothetical protein
MDDPDNSSRPQTGGDDGSAAAQTDTGASQTSAARTDSSTSRTLADDGSSTSTQTDTGGDSTSAQTDTGASQTSAARTDGPTTATLADAASQTDPATQAQFLAAAGQDADLNAGTGQVGDPAAGCTDEPSNPLKESVSTMGVLGDDAQPTAGPLPGALEVTVLNALDGTPIQGANVIAIGAIDGQTAAGVSDVSGKVTFNPLNPDQYTGSASKDGFIPATESKSVPAGSTKFPVKMILWLEPVTVTLASPLTVACPGHPFEIDADGNPPGGDFSWSISGDGQLTDSNLYPLNDAPTVFLVSYQPDNASGKIPPKSATVSVTYSLRGGSASASQTVPIHGIDFDVTNENVEPFTTVAEELDDGIRIGGGGSDEISTHPQVQIRLDASCPRKAECASNHRVGWLQTVLADKAQFRYDDHTEVDCTLDPLPIRDSAAKENSLPPFYYGPFVKTFGTGSDDTQVAAHSDSPGFPPDDIPWQLPSNPGTFGSTWLTGGSYAESFAAWLVVQNIEWSAHDVGGSFVFLRNFTWSVALDFNVDYTKPRGQRCSPRENKVPGATLATGKGALSPELGQKTANNSGHKERKPQ